MQQRESPAINQGDEQTPKYNSSSGGRESSTANLQSHSLQTGTAIDEGKQEIIDEIGKATDQIPDQTTLLPVPVQNRSPVQIQSMNLIRDLYQDLLL